MNLQPARPEAYNRRHNTHFSPATILVVAAILILGLAACRPQGTFHSAGDQPAPGASFLGIPEPVTLLELAEDPFLYRHKFIRVSGLYTPPEAFKACLRNVRGPAGRWFVSGINWQLEVSGYEQVAPRLQPGTPMTIDGIFTYYEGPLGCGKGAARESLWYLQATHIEEPNPLPLIALRGGANEFASGNPGLVMSGTVTTTTPVSVSPAESGTITPTLDPAGQTPTFTPTLATPTATVPAGTTPATGATTAPSPAVSATPTMTPTPTPTTGPTDTPGGSPTQDPPSPTPPNGDGYPPPAQETNTPGPYP